MPETGFEETEGQLAAQVEVLLSAALASPHEFTEDVEGGESRLIDLSFIPKDKKVLIAYDGEAEEGPITYTVKPDAHTNQLVDIPDGRLEAQRDYPIEGVLVDTPGLVVSIGFQGRGYSHFRLESLEGLTVKVADKTTAELVRERLSGLNLEDYEISVRKSEKHAETAATILRRVHSLPEFPLDSTERYTMYLTPGNDMLYKITEDGQLVEVLRLDRRFDGSFLGNRFALMRGRLVLIDDASGLAIGATESESGKWGQGFSALKYVDIADGTRDMNNHHLLGQLARAGILEQTP